MTRPWEAEWGLCDADPDCPHGQACRIERCTDCGSAAHVLGFRSPEGYVCRRCEEARYGACSVCGREMRVRKDGTLRHHGGPRTGGWGNRDYRCDGSGLPAAKP